MPTPHQCMGKNQNEYYKYQGCGIIHSEKDAGLNPLVLCIVCNYNPRPTRIHCHIAEHSSYEECAHTIEQLAVFNIIIKLLRYLKKLTHQKANVSMLQYKWCGYVFCGGVYFFIIFFTIIKYNASHTKSRRRTFVLVIHHAGHMKPKR